MPLLKGGSSAINQDKSILHVTTLHAPIVICLAVQLSDISFVLFIDNLRKILMIFTYYFRHELLTNCLFETG